MADKTRATIVILTILVIILALVVVYAFLVQPAISSYISSKQISAYNQGQADLLNTILLQIQQAGYVGIPIGNQTLILAPVQTQQP